VRQRLGPGGGLDLFGGEPRPRLVQRFEKDIYRGGFSIRRDKLPHVERVRRDFIFKALKLGGRGRAAGQLGGGPAAGADVFFLAPFCLCVWWGLGLFGLRPRLSASFLEPV